MSAEPTDSKNPILSFIGNAFLFLVPVSLIVMLGIVGVAFVGGMSPKDKKPEVAAAPATSVASEAVAAAPAATAAAPATATAGTTPAAPPAGSPAAPAIDPAVMALGKASYATCAACHGPDGTGLKVGPALMAPSLVGSQVLLGDPARPLLVVLKGIAKEDMKFMGMMAPLGAALDDQKLAAVLTYVRNEWGNSAPAVTVEEAAAARAKFGAINAPAGVKRAEIDQIVAAHK